MLWKSKSGLFHSLSRVSATQASHTVQQSTLTELFVFPLQSSFTGRSGCADCQVPGSAAGHRTPGKSKPMESILKHIFLGFFDKLVFFLFLFDKFGVYLAGISSYGAPSGSFISLWGWLTLPPPAHPAAQCPETPPSCSGHPYFGPRPAPWQLQVKPTMPSHTHTCTHVRNRKCWWTEDNSIDRCTSNTL